MLALGLSCCVSSFRFSKGTQPSLSLSEPECLPVEPGNEAQPEKFAFARMGTAVRGSVMQKTWAAVVQKGLHLWRNTRFHLHNQAHPECECAPLDVLVDAGGEAFGIRESELDSASFLDLRAKTISAWR